jgi:YHS domain-containing protein
MAVLIYFLFLAGLFVLMMRFGCGRHVMGHGHHGRSPSGERQGPEGTALDTAPESAVDPVCGMTVLTSEAKSAVRAGHAYYFCSASCRDKFESSPASYLKGAATAPTPMEHRHGIAH